MEEKIVECAFCAQKIDVLHEPHEFVDLCEEKETWYYHCYCYVQMRRNNGAFGAFLLQ